MPNATRGARRSAGVSGSSTRRRGGMRCRGRGAEHWKRRRRCAAQARGFDRAAASAGTKPVELRSGNGSAFVGRRLRQQCLAARAASATDEAHLGQSAADLAAIARAALNLRNGDQVRAATGAPSVTLRHGSCRDRRRTASSALLGFGRNDVGMVGKGSDSMSTPLTGGSGPIGLRKSGGSATLACTEHHDPPSTRAGNDYCASRHAGRVQADPDSLADRRTAADAYNRQPTAPPPGA